MPLVGHSEETVVLDAAYLPGSFENRNLGKHPGVRPSIFLSPTAVLGRGSLIQDFLKVIKIQGEVKITRIERYKEVNTSPSD